MCPMFEGIPAIIYSALWIHKTYGKLKQLVSELTIKIVLFLTDFPPATMIEIKNGDFEIKVLDDIKKVEDLEDINCDAYLALPTEVFLGGAEAIMKGIAEKTVKVKNPNILSLLGKIMGVL